MAESAAPQFSLGQRVQDEKGFRATVRYIGPVCTSKDKDATWIGVEFDDAARGKHDGAVESEQGELVRYLSCTDGGSGSFLKPHKIDAGAALADALAAHYVAVDAPLVAPDNKLVGQYAQTVRGRHKQIEFFGEGKIRLRQQVSALDACTLRGASVSRCGGSGGGSSGGSGSTSALSRAAGHLVSLDLKDNLLSDWQETFEVKMSTACPAHSFMKTVECNVKYEVVAAIGRSLPNLRTLALAGNKMQPLPRPAPPLLAGAFDQLEALVLNSAGLKSWRDVATLVPLLPALRELYLASNRLGDVLQVSSADTALSTDATAAATAPGTGARGGSGIRVAGMDQLRVLDLSDCGLDSWEQVVAFAALPALVSLILNHNPIPSVGPIDYTADFQALEALQLVGCAIASWADVDALSGVAALRSLRFGACPLTANMSAAEARAIVIARLPSIHKVNGSPVGPRERVEAERAYLRMVAREATAAMQDKATRDQWPAQLQRQHPQHARLAALWGAATIGASNGGNAGTGGASLASAMVQRTFPVCAALWGAATIGATNGGNASTGGASLASTMVQVTLLSEAAASRASPPALKKLPSSLAVGRLKQLLKRLFGLDTDLQVLYMTEDRDAAARSPLDDDSRPLSYYGIANGCQIIMSEAGTQCHEAADAAASERVAREQRELQRQAALEAAKRQGHMAQIGGAVAAAALPQPPPPC
ncbi:putative beta-tubulin folding cofactor E [Tribonema minus]|uniref:Putative beta-tubulin folding cofactor E n=1 Tax=Tribonema minus TaxID=303371 RepID=A0A835YMA8_9STRA|nr:putative beta-tubulin folding cofactor E [Tribonema minus]